MRIAITGKNTVCWTIRLPHAAQVPSFLRKTCAQRCQTYRFCLRQKEQTTVYWGSILRYSRRFGWGYVPTYKLGAPCLGWRTWLELTPQIEG